MSLLKTFSDFSIRDFMRSASNSEEIAEQERQELMNSPLYKDIATEQFYVLVKGKNGIEQRKYLSPKQLQSVLS